MSIEPKESGNLFVDITSVGYSEHNVPGWYVEYCEDRILDCNGRWNYEQTFILVWHKSIGHKSYVLFACHKYHTFLFCLLGLTVFLYAISKSVWEDSAWNSLWKTLRIS